jgi:hypothetical protein
MRSFSRARRFRTARCRVQDIPAAGEDRIRIAIRCLGNLSARAKREQYRRGKKQPQPNSTEADSYWTEKPSADSRNFIFCKHDRFLLLLM